MEEEAFSQYLTSVQEIQLRRTNELTLIREQGEQREAIYKKCLGNYLSSLNEQTQTIEKTAPQVEKRHATIRSAFEEVYNSVMDGSDITMRQIRRTFDRKRNFWSQAILEYAQDPSLELKTFLHEQKAESLELFRDAVEARRQLSKLSYRALVKEKERNGSLAFYTRSNNQLENQVLRGGINTLDKWNSLHQVEYDNKENQFGSQNQPQETRDNKELDSSSGGVINNFMVKK